MGAQTLDDGSYHAVAAFCRLLTVGTAVRDADNQLRALLIDANTRARCFQQVAQSFLSLLQFQLHHTQHTAVTGNGAGFAQHLEQIAEKQAGLLLGIRGQCHDVKAVPSNFKSGEQGLAAWKDPCAFRQQGKPLCFFGGKMSPLFQLVGDILAEGQLLSAQLGDCLDAGGVRLYLADQRTQDEGLRLCAGKQGAPQTADVTDRQLLDLIAQHTQLFFHVRGCQQSAGASGIDPDDVYFQMIPPRLRSWFRG